MILSLALTAILLAASAMDLTRLRIPNLIPLALIGFSLLRMASTAEPIPWPSHLGAFGLMLMLGFLAFAGGLIGGGDVKLMAALALWFGPLPLASFVVLTGISGGILASILLLLRWLMRQPGLAAEAAPAQGSPAAPGRPKILDPGAPIPYALPITFAALCLEWL